MTTDDNFRKFLVSFGEWFSVELPYTDYIYEQYLGCNNWNGDTYFLDIDYGHLYKLHLGIKNFQYKDIFNNQNCQIEDFKVFIELIYEKCIKDHYHFTIEANNRLANFNMPYRLKTGKLIREGYKGTERIEEIINYAMCERKIRFSEEMISNSDLLDKKTALDYIVDSLQYLISIADGKRISDKYRKVALDISEKDTNKIYTVIQEELNDIMKISNEFFDIRHNEYLNKAKEQREPLNDAGFIEYLYNRFYALVHLIRLRMANKCQGTSEIIKNYPVCRLI